MQMLCNLIENAELIVKKLYGVFLSKSYFMMISNIRVSHVSILILLMVSYIAAIRFNGDLIRLQTPLLLLFCVVLVK